MKTAHSILAAARARILEVPVSASEAAIERADVLIDIRDADEFQAGHLPGAINIPRGRLELELAGRTSLADPGVHIVLYSNQGDRAALAAATLVDMGYAQVRSILGGYSAWVEMQMPVVRPEHGTRPVD